MAFVIGSDEGANAAGVSKVYATFSVVSKELKKSVVEENIALILFFYYGFKTIPCHIDSSANSSFAIGPARDGTTEVMVVT